MENTVKKIQQSVFGIKQKDHTYSDLISQKMLNRLKKIYPKDLSKIIAYFYYDLDKN